MSVDWRPIQSRLGVTADDIPGPRTWAAVFNFVADQDLGVRARDLGIGAATHLAPYEINCALRIAHFLGQTAHESGRYQFMREIWGPTKAQLGYEGRLDLGNDQPGDGRRYIGRSPMQITGRDNYRRTGARIGIDLEANPVLAERPDIAILIAADWWEAHGCNALADADQGVKLGRLINRGSAAATRPANGEADRIALTNRAKGLFA